VLNTGNRNVGRQTLPTRQILPVRELFDAEDTLEAGSAVGISGNVDGGIYLSSPRNADGLVTGTTTISQVHKCFG